MVQFSARMAALRFVCVWHDRDTRPCLTELSMFTRGRTFSKPLSAPARASPDARGSAVFVQILLFSVAIAGSSPRSRLSNARLRTTDVSNRTQAHTFTSRHIYQSITYCGRDSTSMANPAANPRCCACVTLQLTRASASVRDRCVFRPPPVSIR